MIFFSFFNSKTSFGCNRNVPSTSCKWSRVIQPMTLSTSLGFQSHRMDTWLAYSNQYFLHHSPLSLVLAFIYPQRGNPVISDLLTQPNSQFLCLPGRLYPPEPELEDIDLLIERERERSYEQIASFFINGGSCHR